MGKKVYGVGRRASGDQPLLKLWLAKQATGKTCPDAMVGISV
jgi:hypothetical protein